MEKQSNLDLEQTKQERTLTSTDGPLPSQETPVLNLVYAEDGLNIYLAAISGEISLHNDIQGPLNAARLKHLKDVFACLLLCLMDRGLPHLDTWVEEDDARGIRFAEAFGFEDTDVIKLVRIGETDFRLKVMRIPFPEIEEGPTE